MLKAASNVLVLHLPLPAPLLLSRPPYHPKHSAPKVGTKPSRKTASLHTTGDHALHAAVGSTHAFKHIRIMESSKEAKMLK